MVRRLALLTVILLAPARALGADGAPDPRDVAVLSACGPGDSALAEVAGRLARRKLAGEPPLPPDELAMALHEAGAPWPSPKALAFGGRGVPRGEAAARAKKWAEGMKRRRCGVGSAEDAQGNEAVVVVAVPVLAEVPSVPLTARVGVWITLEATILVPASAVRVVVLGPRGAPRNIPASLHDGRVVARFAADQPGRWIAQLVAELDDGPRPVAELAVRVGEGSAVAAGAPGEGETRESDGATVIAMINAARSADGLGPLSSEPLLAGVASRHAAAMARTATLAHDTGAGDPEERSNAAGIHAREVGENVARATTLAMAHRMIWSSPSHRANVLSGRFSAVGVGVARGKDGSLWIAQLFSAR